MEIIIKDNKFKEMLKEALVELLKEKREEFLEVITESLEDFFLGEAITEGLKTKDIKKEEILNILEI